MRFIDNMSKNIRRTPYQAIAASMVMFLTFWVLSVFLLLALGSNVILRFYEAKPQAIAFFKDGTSDQDVTNIENALQATGEITKFNYITKDQALQIYRDKNKDNPLLLELVTANILPASLEISTKSPDDLQTIAEIVKKEPVVDEVIFPQDVVKQLTQATRLIRGIGLVVVGFLVTFSTLILMMIIGFKIRVKRSEIEIMKLLGASTWFIRLPYIFEGMFYGALGALLGWLVSVGILYYFEPVLIAQLGDVSSVIFPLNWIVIAELLGIEILVAIVVGAVGSLIAVRRYLKI